MNNYITIISLCLAFIFSCNKNDRKEATEKQKNSEFTWKDNVQVSDLPEYGVKGILNGREVIFESITLEKWRGSNDNVLNFSLRKPEQPCGFIENYEGFQLVKKGNIEVGEFVKSGFSDNQTNYSAFFKYINSEGLSLKSDALWNCVLKIENQEEKIVKGHIILCFNDPAKSWIAGKFEAGVCNN